MSCLAAGEASEEGAGRGRMGSEKPLFANSMPAAARNEMKSLAGSANKKPWVALTRQSTAYFEVKLAADLRRVESLREWRGSGVLSTASM